ncbi:hypothetical protein D0962_30725 [Leptolyngbyaceae cyanobacterium CCMR0082]|uniref:Uncharacterized protein n=1 Tax=Adonisia turfae CCMR0082 TaxID=2304604 RepID=A0A6M0SFI4_9CYAN|nr:hypothetical protein [Adonisia turfae]NEZ67076.1 hypothetical protein [Adonisia turfae CCMR0082]
MVEIPCDSPPASEKLNIDLLKIWLIRYLPKLGLISLQAHSHVKARLAVAVSAEARQETRRKVLGNLTAHCTMSGLRAQHLMMDSHMPLQILEAQKITHQIVAIYQYLMEAYVRDFVFAPVLHHLHTTDSKQVVALQILPKFHQLMQGLAPLLKGLQSLISTSTNLRAIGFLSTQIHLSRQRILSRLDVYERIWLSPYLQLTEELLCMPWQRVCIAAGNHSSNSPAAALVTKMLPLTEPIASAVYHRALRTFPNHVSRQGCIQSDPVQTSSVRDLSMFQTYIWLSLLEGNISVIKNELLPLCLLVFPCSKVSWQFVQYGIQWLSEEIYLHLTSPETLMFSSYIKPIQRLFKQADPDQIDLVKVNSKLTIKTMGHQLQPVSLG